MLDVPSRLKLMESFGLCAWHLRQVPALPAICAPNVGFAIFAADLLRKFDYVGRAVAAEHSHRRRWKFWLSRTRRRLMTYLKEGPCPACAYQKQRESYRLQQFMESVGDADFFGAYQSSQGICLPHFLLLEEAHFSHGSFQRLLEAQLAKATALRDTLEEYIRKQNFRLSSQITAEEARAWQTALETFAGGPGVFSNEMEHDLFRRSRSGKAARFEPAPARSASLSNERVELLASLRSATHVALYLRKPPPEILLDVLTQLAGEGAGGLVEVVAEEFADTGFLRRLHEARISVFYGIGLPEQATIIVDGRRGYLVDEDGSSGWRLRRVKNPRDVSLAMVWHRFGNTIDLEGVVRQTDDEKQLFCMAADERREQWCRLKRPASSDIPPIGRTVRVFGWQKWYSHIIEVLELDEVASLK